MLSLHALNRTLEFLPLLHEAMKWKVEPRFHLPFHRFMQQH